MMEINPFILALSKTLPESCLQGLVIYLLLQLLFFVDKRSTPLLRFNLFYAANWFLFIGFIFTFCYHYQQIQVKQFDVNLLQNISKNNYPIITTKPNLWLQFNFWTNHYAYVITAFYLLGLLFCILKLTIGLINISWFRNNKNLKLDDYLTQLSIQLYSNFGLIKTVSVFVSDQISVPLTLGFIKPIIVFPIALINQLSAEQTEAILLHELAHIKRNDYLLNLLLCIIQSFLFFNPAIWLMKRETNKYREQCCDDLVLDNTQHKIAYARALLLIEESRNTQLTLTLASNGKKYTLLNRIKRITDMKTNENSPQNKLVVLLLALIVVGLTVAWNIPVKKTIKNLSFTHFRVIKEALKKLPDHQVTGFKLTVIKRNKPTLSWSADKITIAHTRPDTSHIKLISDSIVFQPNSKSSKKYLFAGKNIVLDFKADTAIKSKNKFKIVLEDSLGNKREYNSIDELPIKDQKEFLKENRKFGVLPKLTVVPGMNFKLQSISGLNNSNRLAYIENFRSNPEWEKKAEAIRKQGEELYKQGEAIRKQFNSLEWKAQIEKLHEQSKAIREQARKQFDTVEFKKQTDKGYVQSFQDNKVSDETLKYYNSPEWKKQQEKIKKAIEKSQKEWRKNYDKQRSLAMPETTIKHQY